MSNIDKQQIRDDIAKRKAMPDFGISSDANLERLRVIQETQKSFGLEVVEALLDELEAKDQMIAELEAREVVLPQPAQWNISEVLLDKVKVMSAIRAAGIRINGEG